MYQRYSIAIDEVLNALQVFETIPIRFVDVDLGQAVVLASEMNLYAYDAYMVEVAERYHSPLLTLDKRLADAAKNRGMETILVRSRWAKLSHIPKRDRTCLPFSTRRNKMGKCALFVRMGSSM